MSFVTTWFKAPMIVGLLSFGAILLSSLPAMARPATLYTPTNVRTGASLNATVLEVLPANSPIEVLNAAQGSDGNIWYYICPVVEGDQEGWVRSDLVSLKRDGLVYGTLGGERGERGDRINIRSVPRMDSEILHYGLTGDVVRVDSGKSSDGYFWHHVTFPNGADGWVRYDLISVGSKN